MVFSITSGVPCAALVLDRYYYMKLRGVADDYPGMATLIPGDAATPQALAAIVERAFAAATSGGVA
jgi:hypothetical protein